jgi:acetoin utilization deacetylase AcuC-like enzyme
MSEAHALHVWKTLVDFRLLECSYSEVMGKTGLVFDPRFIRYLKGENHPERPERLKAVHRELADSSLLDQLIHIPSRLATREELERFHTPDYIRQVEQEDGDESNGEEDRCAGKPVAPYTAARLAAGGVLNGVDRLLAGAVEHVVALVRPPGHHAERDRGRGFCIFNNVALGALHALHRHGLSRVLVVDWDIHHGNGTQQAFYDTSKVLFFSVHRHDLFPRGGTTAEIGRGEGQGYTVNVTLEHGYGNGMYEAVFTKILEPIVTRYRPELILVSAGFDAYYLDDLGLMKVTSEGYVRMASHILGMARRFCQGKVLFCLEGGYHVLGLARTVRYLVEVCLDKRPPLSIFLAEPPAFGEVLCRTEDALAEMWPDIGTRSHATGVKSCLWDGSPIDCDDLRLTFHAAPEEGQEWLEADLDGAVVGRAKIVRTDGTAVVKFITTHSKVERQGVAGRIVRFLQERHPRVVAQGVKFQAKGFWKRLGFARVDQSKDYVWRR